MKNILYIGNYYYLARHALLSLGLSELTLLCFTAMKNILYIGNYYYLARHALLSLGLSELTLFKSLYGHFFARYPVHCKLHFSVRALCVCGGGGGGGYRYI
jgi:hypothetical protein